MSQTMAQIIDRGRGPQLSTSRITVQDVLPYLISGDSPEKIRQAMPNLTLQEIAVIEDYIAANRDEVMAEDRKICERNALLRNAPEVEALLDSARRERHLMRANCEDRNGADHPG